MTPYTTHLCLVSAQATPNLLPVLGETWRPRKVVLACSAQMKHAAAALRSITPRQSQLRMAQATIRCFVPDGASLVDELLADRRAENAWEQAS